RIFQFICGRPSTGLKLLDLGCGSGKIVYEFRKRDVNAYGADFELPPENALPKMETPAFRKIDKENYRIPFEDESFDLVFSNEVLEHVSDHLKLFAEIARV